jgi:Sulfotransferase family
MSANAQASIYPSADQLLDSYPLPDYLRDNVRIGLVELLKSMDEATDLNANGRARALHNIRDDLRRLKEIADDRARYPEIADVQIKQPLFILGLPRCGTSVLHALMGSDPQVRAPLQWEVAYPSPPPEAASFSIDPRIAKYEAYLRAQLGGDYEELIKAHPLGPMITQECGSFMTTSFQSSNPVMLSRLPRFYEWFKTIDARFRYEVHKMWLQHMSWRNPREHWVLKIQEHMYKMPALRSVYPDAIFIQPHRDPTTVIASISQLIRVIRDPAYDNQDSVALGHEFVHLWWDGLKCMMDYREANPALPIHDMRYKSLIADPVATIRDAYQQFGWNFTPDSATGIRNWLRDNPAGKHGARSYSLAEFGLDETTVRDIYAEYIDAYSEYM